MHQETFHEWFRLHVSSKTELKIESDIKLSFNLTLVMLITG
jgi:hypothetical protein